MVWFFFRTLYTFQKLLIHIIWPWNERDHMARLLGFLQSRETTFFFYCFTCSPCGTFPYPFFFSLHSPIAKFFITCPSVLWILLLLVLRHILLSSWLFLTIFWIANEMLGKCWVLRFVYCRWLLRYFGYSWFFKKKVVWNVSGQGHFNRFTIFFKIKTFKGHWKILIKGQRLIWNWILKKSHWL